MKRIVFGIFAHPDDEAFLPSGSLIKWVEGGADLHLICATRGENGENPDNVADLGAVRSKEWKKAGKLLGAKSQTQLGYPDGAISNSVFHELAGKVLQTIENKLKAYNQPVKIDLLTYENCGITGHLDHVAVSFITTYVYTQLKERRKSSRLLYACACEAVSPEDDTSFVFMPKGHSHSEIDLTEDISPVLERKKLVMRAHASQRKDAEAIITRLGPNLAYEHFNVFKD